MALPNGKIKPLDVCWGSDKTYGTSKEREMLMSYEVWFGQNGKWFGYHSFKYKMDAKRYEERYQTVFPNLTVEIREREHASV